MPQPRTVEAIEALLSRLRDRDAIGVFHCLDCDDRVSLALEGNCPHCGAPRPRTRLEEHLERVLDQGEAVEVDPEDNALQSRIEALLKDDKKIGAIKLVRTELRAGLRDAKELVEHVQAGGHLEDMPAWRDRGKGGAFRRQPEVEATKGWSCFVNVLIALAVIGGLLSQIWL